MAQEERAFVDMTGTHKAIAREWDFGFVGNDTNRPQVEVIFEILEGDFKGGFLHWFGHFTPKTEERTLESLRHCGWSSADIVSLDGMGTSEVNLVVTAEEYNGKWSNKIQWVNKPVSIVMKSVMDANAKRAFAARMQGLALQSQQSYFGSQAPAQSRPMQARTQQPQQQPARASGGFGGGGRSAPAQQQPRSYGRAPQQNNGYDPGPGAEAGYGDDDIPF